MSPLEKLRRVDMGLARAAERLLDLAGPKMQTNIGRFVELVADRITIVERERDNLYALSASKFDRGELDQVLQASRKRS